MWYFCSLAPSTIAEWNSLLHHYKYEYMCICLQTEAVTEQAKEMSEYEVFITSLNVLVRSSGFFGLVFQVQASPKCTLV